MEEFLDPKVVDSDSETKLYGTDSLNLGDSVKDSDK